MSIDGFPPVSNTPMLQPMFSDWGAKLVAPLGSSLMSKDGMFELAGRVYWIVGLVIVAIIAARKCGYLTGRVNPPSSSTKGSELPNGDGHENTVNNSEGQPRNIVVSDKPPEDHSTEMLSGDTPSDSNEDVSVVIKASVHSILENIQKNLEGVLSSEHPMYQNLYGKLSQFQFEILEQVENDPQGAGNRALAFQVKFRQELFSEARHALSDDIQEHIEKYLKQLMALSSNDQSTGDITKRIECSSQIKNELELIRFQIQELQLQASTPTGKRCQEQSTLIKSLLEMIDETLQTANRLLLEQASAIYTNELLKQGWKIISVPKNGDCLLLSLSGNDVSKAADLRKRVVKTLREKITTNPGLKWTIQSLMRDLEQLVGYPEWFKREIRTRGEGFIASEEGWQAYLKALSEPGVFAGEPELSVLHELVGANIHVYQPKAPALQRDEQGRIFVLDPSLADRHPESFVFSQPFYEEWINSHGKDQKFVPLRRYPEKPAYRDTTRVILREHHYDILVKK
jgi:hypothetical protein